MKTIYIALILVWANVQFGFGAEPLIVDTEKNRIGAVVIRDFNWETQVTTVFRISPDLIEISSDEAKPYKEVVKPTGNNRDRLLHCLKGIGKIYEGDYADEDVVDGVSIKFIFTLKDGSTHSTGLTNLKIDTYADLTRVVSSLVERDVQFHQYNMKSIQSQQGGAGQPATRSESKSEGGDKSQPESEGRSR